MLTTEENAPSLFVTLTLHPLHFSPLHVGAQNDALRRFRNYHRLLVAHSRSPRTRHRHVQEAVLVRHTRLHELVVRVAVRNRLVVAVVRTALIRVAGTSLETSGENRAVQRLEWRETTKDTVEKRGVISPSISVVRNCELITKKDSLLAVTHHR